MNPNPPTPPSEGGDAMDRLRMDARVDARMLKKDQPITDAQRAALIEEVKNYRAAHPRGGKPMSWDKLARHVGVSGSQLSRVVAGSYDADPDPIFRKIDEFLAGEDERSKKPNLKAFQITRLVEDMHAAVKQCINRRTIGVITAENGDGKTLFAQWLRDQHEGAVLITCGPVDCDKRFVIDKLYEAFGLKTLCRFSREKARKIEEHLTTHTNTIIIVDEAQQLTNDGLEMLRSFHDASDPEGRRNVPVVLFGDQDFYKVIINANSGQRTPFSPQITGRMFPIYHAEFHGVQRDSDGDPLPDAVFTRTDIDRIVRQGRLQLFRPEALRFAVKLANLHNWSRLRLAVRVLETALGMRGSGQVTVEHMHRALSICVPAAAARTIIESLATKDRAEPRVAAAAGG